MFRGNHDDGYPFDGPGNLLAHAFPPKEHGAQIHIDLDESWTFQGRGNNSKYLYRFYFFLNNELSIVVINSILVYFYYFYTAHRSLLNVITHEVCQPRFQ